MAISKFSVRMLVLIVICWSLSTCSFKNNYSWTGSRSTDLHSPVPPIYTIKNFPLILSLLSLLLLIVVMLLLAIWITVLFGSSDELLDNIIDM